MAGMRALGRVYDVVPGLAAANTITVALKDVSVYRLRADRAQDGDGDAGGERPHPLLGRHHDHLDDGGARTRAAGHLLLPVGFDRRMDRGQHVLVIEHGHPVGDVGLHLLRRLPGLGAGFDTYDYISGAAGASSTGHLILVRPDRAADAREPAYPVGLMMALDIAPGHRSGRHAACRSVVRGVHSRRGRAVGVLPSVVGALTSPGSEPIGSFYDLASGLVLSIARRIRARRSSRGRRRSGCGSWSDTTVFAPDCRRG